MLAVVAEAARLGAGGVDRDGHGIGEPRGDPDAPGVERVGAADVPALDLGARPAEARAAGDDVDDAADRLGAPEGRGGAVEDLDPLDRVGRDVEVERVVVRLGVVDRLPVHEDQRAVVVGPAEGDVGLDPGAAAPHVDGGEVPEEVGQRAGRQPLDLLAAEDGDRRGLRPRSRVRGDDGDLRLHGGGRVLLLEWLHRERRNGDDEDEGERGRAEHAARRITDGARRATLPA